MNSILDTIKKMLNIDTGLYAFDTEIIVHINSALMTLNQLGVGPDACYSITGSNETWSDFLGVSPDFEAVKSYIYLKVKMVFDPPPSSYALDALKRQADDYEWRLNIQAESEV